MATQASIASRRDIAARAIERRAQGIARSLGIKFPPQSVRNYPDPDHRQADKDERVAEILTLILRKIDPKSKDLADPPQGVVSEYNKEHDMPEGSHSGIEEPKPTGVFKSVNFNQETGQPDVKVQKATPQTAASADPVSASVGQPAPGQKATGAGEDDEDAPTFGTDHHTLAQLEGKSDEELLQLDGIGDATVKKIHAARRKADKSAK